MLEKHEKAKGLKTRENESFSYPLSPGFGRHPAKGRDRHYENDYLFNPDSLKTQVFTRNGQIEARDLSLSLSLSLNHTLQFDPFSFRRLFPSL
jgi:hypothetical protein